MNYKYISSKLLLSLLLPIFALASASAQEETKPKTHFEWSHQEIPVPPNATTQPGIAGAFSGVTNNVLLVAGGANFPDSPPWEGGEKIYEDEIYVLEKTPSGYSWTSKGEFTMEAPAAYGVSIATPEGLIGIGGENGTQVLSNIFMLSWDPVSEKVNSRTLGDLPPGFKATAGVLIDGKVYISGIQDEENSLISINLSILVSPQKMQLQWESLPGCPGPPREIMAYAAQTNGAAPCFYLFNGRSHVNGEYTILQDHYLFNTTTQTWEKLNLPPSGEDLVFMGAPALSFGASNILLFGGDNGKLLLERASLEKAINSASLESTRDSLQLELRKSLIEHPGFQRNIYSFNTITKTFSEMGTLPEAAPVTTNALQWGDDLVIPSGEVNPGVRSPNILIGTITGADRSFGTLNYIVLGIYFLVLLIIGVYFSFRQKSTQDYFKGGGRVPWWAAGLSVFGTALSAITFMAIPAKTFATDWSYLFYNLSILLATPIIVYYFIPFFRRLNITTAYEFLEKRFNLAVRLFGSASFILFQIGRIAIVLYLPSIALSLVTGIDIYFCIITMGIISTLYTLIGGIEAVIWTDVLQVMVLMGGALLALVLIIFSLPGDISETFNLALENGKLHITDFDFVFTEPTIWVVIIGGFFANLVTYSSDQTMVQRYLTTPDEKGAKRSSWTSALLVIPSTLLFFTIGTALFLFYSSFPAKMDPVANDVDAIFPWYIINEMPNGISGLLIAGLFSAAMSSLSSSINSSATSFTTDFYQRFKKIGNKDRSMTVARISTLIAGTLGTLFAIWMSSSDIVSLWDQFFKVLGLFTGGLGGVFFLGIISKQANGKGAIVGLIVSSIGQYFISTYTDIHIFLYAATGFVMCVVVGHLASLVIPDTGNETGKQLTIYNKLYKNKSKP